MNRFYLTLDTKQKTMPEDQIIGFVTVRTSSRRLPSKCLLPFGEGNVLEHIIRRSKSYGIEPIVCTSIDQSDDPIEQIARSEDVRYFRGSLQNKLKRWSDCAQYFNLDSFHTVDADDPFFDGDQIKSSMKLLKTNGLDIVYPSVSSSNGGASLGYSISTKIINTASKSIPVEADTEMFWSYIEKIKGVKSQVAPDELTNSQKIRLTLDYQEDYWLLESVRRITGNLASRDEILNLFKKNPDLYKVNWFRNEEWKQAQIDKISQA